MKKRILSLALCLLVLLMPCIAVQVSAAQPDRGFIYDSADMSTNNAVPSTNTYQVEMIVNETVMGTTRMKNPTSLFVDSEDRIFVMDSGNSRILILNDKFQCISQLKDFRYDGGIIHLAAGAQDMFFRESNQRLYIADTENNRILVSDLKGNVSKIYEKPVDELLDATVEYKPTKVIVDNMGIMYVLSANVNTGAMMVDSANNFLGFYGTNKIKMSARVALEYWWRSILTDAQNALSTESFQPVQFNNIFWTEDRFVYAVSPLSEELESSVVKLNALGENVFPSTNPIQFKNTVLKAGEAVPMHLSDITVEDDGVVTILDMVTGKLYQYDEDCNLLCAFGGIGYQEGLYTQPVSLEHTSSGQLLVLDTVKATITVMEKTFYGEQIRKANSLYNQGLHTESMSSWNEVLRMNANYYLAYVGIGKAYMSMGKYEEAMEYFELGQDKELYADAKLLKRNEFFRSNFAVIATVVVVLLVYVLGYDFFKARYYDITYFIKHRRKGGS